LHCGHPATAVQPSPDAQAQTQADEGPTPAALSGERRQATVLLADVKGSTALAEQVDTETWVEIMNRVFQILGAEIYRYGGQIDQYRGDGLVAFFGIPTAHEDDPERAIRAALAMQAAVARYAAELVQEQVTEEGTGIELLLRVGLNTGEVIAARVGDRQQHTEDTAMGRAVALAARMESAAEPGTVLVTENTYRLTETLFDWRPLGPITVKGVSRPLSVYRPLAARDIPGRGRGPGVLTSPLVGREVEVRAMRTALQRLLDGVGGIVTLVGEAGMGKSRLVAETHKMAQAETSQQSPNLQSPNLQSLQWVEGRCLSYTSEVAYSLWADMLRSLLGVPADAPVRALREALERWVRAGYADTFDQVYPFLARLLAVPLDDETEAVLRGLGAEGVKTGTYRAIETVVERAARARPLVVVSEDLHWADPTSLDLLQHLLALTDRVPLLLICLLRPETGHGCWEIRETAARQYRHRHNDLWLEPLPEGESEQLVGSLLFSVSGIAVEAEPRSIAELDPVLQARIIRHADGNPFYMEEILRSLVESGAIVCDQAACRWDAAPDALSDIVIPDTLQGVLAARIDRLPEEARRVLQQASVVGHVFRYRVLAAVTAGAAPAQSASDASKAQDGDLDTHLVTLLREQMIHERARLPEREYMFKHVLTQEAAYNSLLRRESREIHARVARALEQLYPERLDEQLGLLAYHWERAGEPAQAIPYLLRAGKQARTAYASHEAIAHLQRALALLDDLPSHADPAQVGDWQLAALQGLGQVYESISQLDQADSYLRQAIALGRERGLEPRALARLYYWLGEVLFWEGQFRERIRIGQEGLALLGNDLESVEAALMNQTLAMGLRATGVIDPMVALTRRTAALLEQLPYVEELRPAYRHVGDMYILEKKREKAMAWQQAFEERATAGHDTRSLLEAHILAGQLVEAAGDLQGAIARYEQATEIARQIGDRRDICFVSCLVQATLWRQGALESASSQARESLELAQAMAATPTLMSFCHRLVGIICLAQGETEQAKDFLQEGVRIRRRTESVEFDGPTLVPALGRTHLALGEREEAEQRFSEAIHQMRPGELELFSRELAGLVSGLESAAQDAGAFHALCRRLRTEQPQLDDLPFHWWFLEPGRPRAVGQPSLREEFAAALGPDWAWHDPFGDCAFSTQDGLEIRAANGRDLWKLNQGAPRMLRPASGEFVAQVICARGPNDRPAIGGLLIWSDDRHYLRLDRGLAGDREVTLLGSMDDGQDQVIGRGKLPGSASNETQTQSQAVDGGQIWLRLERFGDRITAFCSADGEEWFTVGHVPFPVRDPVHVGVYASGEINRTIYRGAYPDGTAIRFESFELWFR